MTRTEAAVAPSTGCGEPGRPTSWPQNTMLRQFELNPADTTLTLVRLMRVRGEVDPELLRCAVDSVLRRDPGLAVRLGRVSKVVSDEGVAAGVSVLTVGGLPG